MSNINDNEVALEVLAPSSVEALERAQVDVQIATAHKFPRSLEQFKRRAMDMVSQDIETAESCIYSRPVGGGKVVEGESIRMAEIVAACYGNLRFAAQVVEQTERYVKCEGVAHDLESNVAGKSQAMESTVKRDGSPYDERMRIVVAKACLSKALRDAIFRVVPKGLCKSISDSAKKVIAGQSKTLEQRRTMAKQWLTQIKVDETRAFAVLGVKGWTEVGEQELLVLTGFKTALKDNEITLLEAFPMATKAEVAGSPVPTPPPEAKQPAAAASVAAAPSAPAAASTAPQTPLTPPAATAAPAPGAPEADKDAITCKFCHEKVQDMATHNCAPMQAKSAEIQNAAAKKEGTPPPAAKTVTAAATAKPVASASGDSDAVQSIALLCREAGVSEKAVMTFAQRNKIAKQEQNSMTQLAERKLIDLGKAWQNIIAEIQKIEAEINPPAA